jgi:hypothetical protein
MGRKLPTEIKQKSVVSPPEKENGPGESMTID